MFVFSADQLLLLPTFLGKEVTKPVYTIVLIKGKMSEMLLIKTKG